MSHASKNAPTKVATERKEQNGIASASGRGTCEACLERGGGNEIFKLPRRLSTCAGWRQAKERQGGFRVLARPNLMQ